MGILNTEKHIVSCPHCGKDVLDHMKECPFCKGELKPTCYDPRPTGEKTPQQKVINTVFWLIAIASVVMLILRNT